MFQLSRQLKENIFKVMANIVMQNSSSEKQTIKPLQIPQSQAVEIEGAKPVGVYCLCCKPALFTKQTGHTAKFT